MNLPACARGHGRYGAAMGGGGGSPSIAIVLVLIFTVNC